MRKIKALAFSLMLAGILAASSSTLAKTPRHAPCCRMIHCCKRNMSCCRKAHHSCCSGKHIKGGCCCKKGTCPMPNQ